MRATARTREGVTSLKAKERCLSLISPLYVVKKSFSPLLRQDQTLTCSQWGKRSSQERC